MQLKRLCNDFMTPEQALSNLTALVQHPQLRILNWTEFETMAQSIKTLREAITKKPESEPE